MASEILSDVKLAIRVKSDSSDGDIDDMIEACKREMQLAGVYIKNETDALAKQAIKLYCKGHYGYDENTEKFIKAYESLRDSMALSGEYKKEETDGGETDMDGTQPE